jgi:hypothetical protein
VCGLIIKHVGGTDGGMAQVGHAVQRSIGARAARRSAELASDEQGMDKTIREPVGKRGKVSGGLLLKLALSIGKLHPIW